SGVWMEYDPTTDQQNEELKIKKTRINFRRQAHKIEETIIKENKA
ncbi:23754_t:CDS:1, partial [Gigaspora margarita]